MCVCVRVVVVVVVVDDDVVNLVVVARRILAPGIPGCLYMSSAAQNKHPIIAHTDESPIFSSSLAPSLLLSLYLAPFLAHAHPLSLSLLSLSLSHSLPSSPLPLPPSPFTRHAIQRLQKRHRKWSWSYSE